MESFRWGLCASAWEPIRCGWRRCDRPGGRDLAGKGESFPGGREGIVVKRCLETNACRSCFQHTHSHTKALSNWLLVKRSAAQAGGRLRARPFLGRSPAARRALAAGRLLRRRRGSGRLALDHQDVLHRLLLSWSLPRASFYLFLYLLNNFLPWPPSLAVCFHYLSFSPARLRLFLPVFIYLFLVIMITVALVIYVVLFSSST